MITQDSIYKKLKNIKISGTTCLFTKEKCTEIATLANEINTLKKEQNAIILVHSYVSPEIVYSVADYVGDSYGLSVKAQNTKANKIIFCAVKFMAETAKILNPEKEVLIPSQENGCTLADAITAKEVKKLRKQYPEHSFICYINTTAEVKAECDICVTSSNVYHIISTFPNDKIYFLPDKLMGKNVKDELTKNNIKKEIIFHDATCYVHEKFEPENIKYLKLFHPDIKVLSHPECSAEIVKLSDFVGSTSQMINYVKDNKSKKFFLLTECGLVNRLQIELPNKEFVGSCTLCKYMKANTLTDILNTLKQPKKENIIQIDENTRKKALETITKMLNYNS
jgi:quinolinate synthase